MYERLMALNPKRFDMYLSDAISQMPGEENEKKVLAWAKKIFEKYPDKSAVPLRIANLHSSRRRHAAAAEYYRKAVGLIGTHPSKLSIYFRLIESQIAAEKYADAEQTCGEAAKLRIRSSSLRKRVANLLKKARDLQGKPAGE
jgi:tetratricopeptide (TPR) repeat protein